MDEANRCDRVALIQNGTIFSINSPKAITKDFGRTVYSIKGKNRYRLITDLRLCPSIESAHPFGDSIHVILSDMCDDIAAVKKWLYDNNHSQFAIEESTPGIEDFFLQWSTRLMENKQD
jgi:ABC-type multidrug transport system ATPase subunit